MLNVCYLYVAILVDFDERLTFHHPPPKPADRKGAGFLCVTMFGSLKVQVVATPDSGICHLGVKGVRWEAESGQAPRGALPGPGWRSLQKRKST